ncbi:hypothetical protein NN561_019146 [Cricetulus griseus]
MRDSRGSLLLVNCAAGRFVRTGSRRRAAWRPLPAGGGLARERASVRPSLGLAPSTLLAEPAEVVLGIRCALSPAGRSLPSPLVLRGRVLLASPVCPELPLYSCALFSAQSHWVQAPDCDSAASTWKQSPWCYCKNTSPLWSTLNKRPVHPLTGCPLRRCPLSLSGQSLCHKKLLKPPGSSFPMVLLGVRPHCLFALKVPSKDKSIPKAALQGCAPEVHLLAVVRMSDSSMTDQMTRLTLRLLEQLDGSPEKYFFWVLTTPRAFGISATQAGGRRLHSPTWSQATITISSSQMLEQERESMGRAGQQEKPDTALKSALRRRRDLLQRLWEQQLIDEPSPARAWSRTHERTLAPALNPKVPPMDVFPSGSPSLPPPPEPPRIIQHPDQRWAHRGVLRAEKQKPPLVHHHHHYAPPTQLQAASTSGAPAGYSVWPPVVAATALPHAASFLPTVSHLTEPTTSHPSYP